MKKKYDFHPDFCKYNISFPFTPVFLMMAAPLQKFMLHMVPLPAGITSRQFTVAGYRNLKVPVEIYEPANSPSALPCLLYFHGGGFGLKGAPCHKQLAILYAHKACCRVVFPDSYLETAEFDCLHDEGIAYAKRLRNAGGNVRVYETGRTIHGYDIVLHNPITKNSIRKRVNALRTAFSPKT